MAETAEPTGGDDPVDPTRTGLVIAAAVGVVGITFGVLARSAGLSIWQAQAMSLLVFTGASQFAVVSVLASGGSVVAGLGAAVLLAARNALYGAVVSRWFEGPRWQRLLVAHVVIDESTGVGAAQPDIARARRGFLVTGVGVLVCWNIGTALGAFAGDLIGDPGRYGLDAAFPAAFLALLAPHLRVAPRRVAATVAAAIAVVTVPLAPVGVPILLAVAAVVPGARAGRGSSAVPIDPGGAST